MIPGSSLKIEMIVIGASAGGVDALTKILSQLPANYPIPIAVVLHIAPHTSRDLFSKSLGLRCKLTVTEAEEKEVALPGHVYLAPADYHLLVEKNHTLSLSCEDRVNFSRPSIDVLFQSAARSFRQKLMGIILTGANHDGAEGLKTILAHGGTGLIEKPETAKFAEMPKAAIAAIGSSTSKLNRDYFVISLDEMAERLVTLGQTPAPYPARGHTQPWNP